MTATIRTTMPDGTALTLTQRWRVVTPTTTIETADPATARDLARNSMDARIETSWASRWERDR